MKIAIIGSGIAGLTAAHLLARQHELTVYEKEGWIGGHTHTLDVHMDGQQLAIDTGFIVYNDRTYPNFMKLMTQLGVESQATEMSFSVHDPHSGFEYNGHSLNSLFARRRHLLSTRFWRMLADMMRFNRQALDDLAATRLSDDLNLGQYLRQGSYGNDFIHQYIVPMGAAIWSMSLADMMAFPAHFFLRFFRHHGLLSINDRPQWRVIQGGSNAYIEPLIAPFRDSIKTHCPVTRVRRDDAGVMVESSAGSARFDQVIFACHSDQALSLLEAPSAAESRILGAIPYADNNVVLHTDSRLLPRRKRAWASWNYRLGQAAHLPASVTYNMNILQGLDSPTTFCVSLNQEELIDPAKILARFTYSHPQYSLAGMEAQSHWGELSGANHSHFCGAYWGNGFHEDGVTSALRVAEAFGETL